MPTIDQSFSPRHNSLNFLRLILALLVVFSHAITLGGFGSEAIFDKTTLGTVAVFGFFGISGYLIAGSADRNRTGRYLWQRFLRIFPAFWVCLLVTAFVFGTLAYVHYNPGLSSSCGPHCYLTAPRGPVGYVINNFLLQVNQPTINHTLPPAVFFFGWNGSLWTLEMEFVCYLLLAVLAAVGLLRRRALVAVLALVTWIATAVIISVPSLARDFSPYHRWDLMPLPAANFEVMALLGLVPIFLSGSLLYLYREKVPDSGAIALGATILFLLGLLIPVGQGETLIHLTSPTLTAVFLAYLLIWLGIHLPFSKIGARNDYSYGVYIYAFPLQQLLVMWGVNKWGYWPYAFMSTIAVIPCAMASWWIIEKHTLKLKKVDIPGFLRLDPTLSAEARSGSEPSVNRPGSADGGSTV